jgi:hypothetical protein
VVALQTFSLSKLLLSLTCGLLEARAALNGHATGKGGAVAARGLRPMAFGYALVRIEVLWSGGNVGRVG